MSRSTMALTKEQEDFWRVLLIRATDHKVGQPYIAYALFKLKPVSSPGLGTMAVDKYWRCYVDFDYAMEKGVEWASGVLNHEPWHLLRNHLRRYEKLDALPNGHRHDPSLWNIAGDLTINGDIPDLVPKDGLFPGVGPFKDYELNKTAEEYYAQARADKKNFPETCPQCGQKTDDKKNDKSDKGEKDKKDSEKSDDSKDSDKGNKSDDADKSDKGADGSDKSDEKGDTPDKDGQKSDKGEKSDESGDEQGDNPSDSGEQGDSGENGQDGDSDGSGDGQGAGNGHGGNTPHTCSGCGQETQDGDGQGQGQGGGRGVNPSTGEEVRCGSGAGNKLGDYELSEDEGDIVDEQESEEIKQATAHQIRQYAASNPGSVPGNMKVWADQELAAEPVDWRKLLRGQIKKVVSSWTRGKMDYRKSRPNRRQPNKDIIMPAMASPKPRLAVAIDTSGSHLHKLPIVIDQIVDIVKQVGTRGQDLLAFGVDVRASDIKPVNDPHKVLENMRGGGGTDMAVGMEQLAELGRRNKADIGIMLTDLQTGWPKQKPAGPMRYIVCGIVDPNNKWETEWIEKAEKAIGSWAEVIIINVEAGTKKR